MFATQMRVEQYYLDADLIVSQQKRLLLKSAKLEQQN